MSDRTGGRRRRHREAFGALELRQPHLRAVIRRGPAVGVDAPVVGLLPSLRRGLRRVRGDLGLEAVAGAAPGLELALELRRLVQPRDPWPHRLDQVALDGEEKAERLVLLEPDRLSR